MAFSPTEFVKEVGQDKDFHRPWAYMVTITGGPGSALDGQIRLRAESISLPGAAFMSIDNHRPYTSGKVYNIPYVYNPQEISMTHTLDRDSKMFSKYFKWIDSIVDITGPQKFGAYYFDSYKSQMSIFLLDPKDGAIKKTIKVKDVYPSTLDQTQLSWGSNDETTKINVTYRYVSWTISPY